MDFTKRGIEQTILVVDDAAPARIYLRQVLEQLGYAVLEAYDGVQAIDLFERALHQIVLVILDITMPGLDGYETCLRLKSIAEAHERGLPIVPYTVVTISDKAFTDIGCAPRLKKPAALEQIAEAVHNALTQPGTPLSTGVVRDVLVPKAMQRERQVRQGRAVQVAVLTSSLPARTTISALLEYDDVHILTASNTPHALRQVLTELPVRLLIADPPMYTDAAELGTSAAVPVLIVAIAREQLPPLLTNPHMLQRVQGVLDASLPDAPARMTEAVHTLVAGQRYVHLASDAQHTAIVPAAIAQLFADTPLTERTLEVVWLDYQGLNAEAITQRMGIEEQTLKSHWQRIQQRLGKSRSEVRAWVRTHIEHAQASGGAEERARGA